MQRGPSKLGAVALAVIGVAGAHGCGSNSGKSSDSSKLQHPNPIVSQNKPVYSMPGGGQAVTDGYYHNGGWNAGSPTTDAPAWVAINLGAGPTRLLVSWDDGGTYNYQDPAGTTVYGLPSAYHIDVSADSTNGTDGTWTAAATVDANVVRTRAHAVDFTGKSWVKMVITGTPATASNGVHIGEIDVHDISATSPGLPDDTWFFMGDSITAFAYDRALTHQPSFAAGINAASPAFFPAMINGGIGGERSSDGLARIDAALATNDMYRYFVLGYGTNDAGYNMGPSLFQTNMQMLIDKVKAAGRTPVLPRIPYATKAGYTATPMYNDVIDMLTTSNSLRAGPDLYAWFMAHPDQLMSDGLHPNDDGQKAMNKLWTDAMRPLYP